jgi:hypothetical protein
MNADTNQPPPDEHNADLVRAHQELAAALESILGDDYWQATSVSRPMIFTHGWDDESVDTLVISGARAAYAYRENPSGREVWKLGGTAAEVNAAMRALPTPGEPGAPDGSDHTPRPSGTWT